MRNLELPALFILQLCPPGLSETPFGFKMFRAPLVGKQICLRKSYLQLMQFSSLFGIISMFPASHVSHRLQVSFILTFSGPAAFLDTILLPPLSNPRLIFLCVRVMEKVFLISQGHWRERKFQLKKKKKRKTFPHV